MQLDLTVVRRSVQNCPSETCWGWIGLFPNCGRSNNVFSVFSFAYIVMLDADDKKQLKLFFCCCCLLCRHSIYVYDRLAVYAEDLSDEASGCQCARPHSILCHRFSRLLWRNRSCEFCFFFFFCAFFGVISGNGL